MAEVRFYHLTAQPLERALPVMLERSLERGWRALVRGTDAAGLEVLDRHLWTYRDESFLPHGLVRDGAGPAQPVLLSDRHGNPNSAAALFLIDRAEATPDEMREFEITAVLFDGNDEDALDHARGQWAGVAEAGLMAVYWAQNDDGSWVKKTESA